MAVEEAILLAVDKGLSPSTIRFWRNDRSVIIGRSQDIFKEVNIDSCTKYDIRIVRRFTGGGAVYNDYGNLNWSIIIDKSSTLYPKGIFELYEKACRAVVEGLMHLGVKAEFRPPNSIWVEGKKISGLAAYIKKNSVLCHGTLLINADLLILSEVLSNILHPVTNIEKYLRVDNPLSHVKKSILYGFRRLYKIDFYHDKLTSYEKETARQLYTNKFTKDIWNLRGIFPHDS
ncbi:MAG: biotin/lipoate A/B protein ligase family protein [Candidatus Bathyarchaeia archaeon]